MRAIFKVICLVVIIMGLGSCEFDHLHYETNRLALVRIEIDWSETHVTPNGVSAYVFDDSGNKYCDMVLSSNPNRVDLTLAAGDYTVVLHHNSISELSNVGLSGSTTLNTFCISANENASEPTFTVEGDAQKYITEPGDVTSCTLRGIHVDNDDLQYHYYKPDLEDYEQEVNYTYYATPRHVVHIARVIAHIDGLEYAAGAPVAILRGMSGGYNFGLESTTEEDVMEQFYVNTRVTRVDEEGPTEIYVDYNTFGMHTIDSANQVYYLDIRFELLDGTYKYYHEDVSDNIRTEQTETQNLHIIELELEALPETEGGGTGGDDDEGAFDPSLDEWKDVEIVVPL